jgi:hypothetical protein
MAVAAKKKPVVTNPPATLPPHKFAVMPLSKLKPAPYNPRTMSDAALGGQGASLNKFGLVDPIIRNNRSGYVVGGHMRVQALQKAGQTEAEVIIVDLSDKDEKELNVTLNKQTGDWDFTALKKLMAELAPDDEIRNMMGFDDKELKNLMRWGETATANPPGELGITPGEALKIYDNAAIKQIVLYFEAARYVQVMEDLKAVADAQDPRLETNSDVFIFLLKFYADHSPGVRPLAENSRREKAAKR